MTQDLILFGTDGCHLCDEARALLGQAGVQAVYADIVGDEALIERYGIRIPVLRRPDGAELGWPFGLQALKDFLGNSLAPQAHRP